ncbi:NAD(+) synthase [Pueribacillus theae]|uniref:NH(3)-dependent NAD(+) synthetase n=1 Tax=Pueribacillus theae TaxID=2171751 RepID=A0A2U1JZS0_9BACI|nr:NAD(+) synthase [Pueribacillus theae]PWA10726.1 NAD(+) synthase [Pueribacillus theae]
MEKKVNFLVDWLREKVNESKMNGLLVGVSGGIDSAVVAFLIKRAFPDNSLGVIMPVKSTSSDRDDALQVIQKAELDYIDIDLSEAHEVLFHAINNKLKEKNALNEQKMQMGDANLRARIRMSTLYAIANNYGYLVCGTDNAAEWYTGYFTKYGDGGVDINPLIHLKKGQVREMASYLGVPDSVVSKAPSAGLWEGQTDETELGTTYAAIDAFLDGKEIPEKDKAIINKLHEITEHKRNTPAIPPNF